MILTAMIAAVALTSPVEDYFPLAEGTKWTYQDENGLQLIQQAGKQIDIGKGKMATPVSQSASGQSLGSNLYAIDGDTAFLYGMIDPGKAQKDMNLLREPEPVLKVAEGKAEWQYIGELATGAGPVLVQIHSDSNKGPKRKIFDHEVETIVVHAFTRYGNDPKVGVEVRQDMIYAKGIGMVETTEATKAQGKTVKKMLKLVKFEPPQG
ncbi:MAG TPA: hypothetical protein VHE55_13990 [Fimbriimonadaceae bacterium]|nr:hypothetical protein [Fimbriimonadaceae bacterium]